ncbi:MAG: hypothetical protein J5848_01930 [Bacteroidales bacterium]|nr:hypothetical protein [Bacteroidales bacterium]
MALIPCPECGRMVSPNAEECPGCGAPLRELLFRPAEEKEVPYPTKDTPVKKRGNGVVWNCVAVLAVATLVYFMFLRDIITPTETSRHTPTVDNNIQEEANSNGLTESPFADQTTAVEVVEPVPSEPAVETQYETVEGTYEYYDFFANGDDFDRPGATQDAKVTSFYFYMDEDNRLSNTFEIINLRPDDTMTYVQFTFCFFSSRSTPKRYDIVPLYNTMNLEHIPGDKAYAGAFCNAPYGKKVKINNIELRHCAWYTKSDDVIGTKVLEVEVRFKNRDKYGSVEHVVMLKGYPKNSRVRKGGEHPPFLT